MIGHSWVSHLESAYERDKRNLAGHDLEFCRISLPRFEDIPKCVPWSRINSETTHVLVFSLYRMAFDRMVFRSKDGRLPEHAISMPNLDFRAEDAIKPIIGILTTILKLAPRAQVYFIIPTMPDLHYYNYLNNIATAHVNVQEWYQCLPNTSPKDLCEATIKVYNELQKLHTPQVKWAEKHTINMSDAVRFMSPKMAHLLKELSTSGNDIYSLGPKGYLKDGVHPTENLVYYFWKMIAYYGILNKNPPPRAITRHQDDHYSYQDPITSTQVREAGDENTRTKLCPRRTYTGEELPRIYSRLALPPLSQPSTSTGITTSMPELRRPFSEKDHRKRPLSPPSAAWSYRSKRREPMPPCLKTLHLTDLDLMQSKVDKCTTYLKAILHSKHQDVNPKELEDALVYFYRRYDD